jgi:hypothetical protein
MAQECSRIPLPANCAKSRSVSAANVLVYHVGGPGIDPMEAMQSQPRRSAKEQGDSTPAHVLVQVSRFAAEAPHLFSASARYGPLPRRGKPWMIAVESRPTVLDATSNAQPTQFLPLRGADPHDQAETTVPLYSPPARHRSITLIAEIVPTGRRRSGLLEQWIETTPIRRWCRLNPY